MRNREGGTILAITGASGSIYAQKMIELLVKQQNPQRIRIIFSEQGEKVWKFEINAAIPSDQNIKLLSNQNLFADIASGSSGYDRMIILPCSMGTLGRIANGISADLITRAADVILKEKKRLILCIREAPYNKIHLENMLKANSSGADIFPLSPFFYNHPTNLDETINALVNRIADYSGLDAEAYRWG
mgnify:FL=1